MVTTIVILVCVVIVLGVAMVYVNRDANIKIEKWKEMYFEEKRKRKQVEEQVEKSEYKLKLYEESHNEKVESLLADLDIAEKKYKQLQERACEVDIKNQKKALKEVKA